MDMRTHIYTHQCTHTSLYVCIYVCIYIYYCAYYNCVIQVLLGVQEAQQKLLSLEVFNKVEVLLDTAKGKAITLYTLIQLYHTAL